MDGNTPYRPHLRALWFVRFRVHLTNSKARGNQMGISLAPGVFVSHVVCMRQGVDGRMCLLRYSLYGKELR